MVDEVRPQPRALVTGGAGFVGSHLVDLLLAEGIAVLVIDDLSTGRAANLGGEARLERLDVASDALQPVFERWRPEIVYHLAAQASVPMSMADPIRDLAVNVIGTHKVGAAARNSAAERLVFVSSGGAVYGETRLAATELTTPAPMSYYGVHKLAGEGHVAQCGLPFAIARPSNIYGPRQGAGLEGAVVASFLEQARASGELRIHGDGSQTRDFIHVSDVVESLIRLGRSDVPSGIWNVAAGRGVSIGELAALVEVAIGSPLPRVFAPGRPGDVAHSAVSAQKLRGIGWRPSINLSDGIVRLLDPRP